MLNCIERREEPRTVQSDVTFDYKNREVRACYEGEVMETRKMTDWEYSCRPEDVYPEIEQESEEADVETMVARREEIAQKEAANQTPSANVNQFSEAKVETAIEGLNV